MIPPILWRQLRSGILLRSLLFESKVVDRYASKHRSYFRRLVLYGAEAWSDSEHGPWHPISRLPADIRALLNMGDYVQHDEDDE